MLVNTGVGVFYAKCQLDQTLESYSTENNQFLHFSSERIRTSSSLSVLNTGMGYGLLCLCFSFADWVMYCVNFI